MFPLSDTARETAQAGPPVGEAVEYQFRGAPGALAWLKRALEDAGAFVQIDHTGESRVWPDDSFAAGAMLAPTAARESGAGA